MKNINMQQAVGNRIFSALFIKKDGSERLMSCRLGVKKGIKNVGRKFDPEEKNLLSVFDMHKRDFRFINLKTCKQIKANGKVITG